MKIVGLVLLRRRCRVRYVSIGMGEGWTWWDGREVASV